MVKRIVALINRYPAELEEAPKKEATGEKFSEEGRRLPLLQASRRYLRREEIYKI